MKIENKIHYLYHICNPKNKGDYSEGYIGETNNFNRRMYQMKDTKNITSDLLKENLINNKHIIKYIILTGSKKFCKYKEFQFRPRMWMGWNKARGGGGGGTLGRINISLNLKRSNNEMEFNAPDRDLLYSRDSMSNRSRLGALTKRSKCKFNNIPVTQLELDELTIVKEWMDIYEISDSLNASAYQIKLCLLNKRRSHIGYSWKLKL